MRRFGGNQFPRRGTGQRPENDPVKHSARTGDKMAVQCDQRDHRTRLDYDQEMFDAYRNSAPYPVGPRTSHAMRADPRHLLFSLARYKFCAKMLEGRQRVLEAGCGDAFGAPIVLQTVGSLHCVDIEPQVIDQNARCNEWGDRLTFACLDLTRERPEGVFDAAFCMDVIEHVPPEREEAFLGNLTAGLTRESVCIVGTPNITADAYASPLSRQGHVNLKSRDSLKAALLPFFDFVFLFSMNDEVVHTGYAPMSHFLIALCAGKRA